MGAIALPELPEVETVRRGLEPVLVGATFSKIEQRRPDLRFPFPLDFAARLTGRRVEALERRAKYLAARLDDGVTLVMHLGMSGSFRIERGEGEVELPGIFHHPRSTRDVHDHVVMTLRSGLRIVYNDPRRFGFMKLHEPGETLFPGMGIEPLGADFTGAALARLFHGRSTPLKAALLDQTLIAGLGNIYVCEALHRAKLSPLRAAGTLAGRDGTATARAKRLAAVIPEVLLEAVAAGGSSLRDHRQTDGSTGSFQQSFRVYDRLDHPCASPRCSGVVGRIVQNGRSTFFCATCQK